MASYHKSLVPTGAIIEMKQTLIVAVVVALMASASEAQLDSCEGCLTSLAQVADWGQENIDVRNKAWDIF